MTIKTVVELEKWMKENCFNFNGYSINGNAINEGFGIDNSGGLFIWYYTERGQKNNLKYFQSEKEIVEFAYNQITVDKWANNHCIGFTTDKKLSDELGEKLDNLGVSFMTDKIPYYGPDQPVHRTFVFGCDFKKVVHLKETYFKEK